MKRAWIASAAIVSAIWLFAGCGGGAYTVKDGKMLWPVEVPSSFQPATYQEVVKKAVAEAGPSVEIVGFDCSFPPCIAMLRDPDKEVIKITQTPAWRSLNCANTFRHTEIDCGAQGVERASFLAPTTGLPMGSSSMARIENLMKQWVCASGKKAWQAQEEESVSDKAEAIAWPEDIPAQYRRENFKAVIDTVLTLEGFKADFVGLECDEPPCIAMFRILEGNKDHPTSSRAWQENFAGGAVGGNYQRTLQMGDCPEEKLLLVSPVWTPGIDPKGLSSSEYLTKSNAMTKTTGKKKFMERQSKRLRARWKKIRENWKCKGK